MKNFKQHFILPAAPDEVYNSITNPISLEIWTGEPAEMSTIPGTEFSLWDGSITGKNLEFEEGKKVVQQWYFGSDSTESIVTIKLHPHKKGCSFELSHTNIPDEAYDDIVDGWKESYIQPLTDFFGFNNF